MSLEPLIIRADASAEIGTGHVMRCLALAQAWQDAGGAAIYCCTSLPTALHHRLTDEGMQVRMIDAPAGSDVDADVTIATAVDVNAVWIVVDGYVFGAAFQLRIKDAGRRLLFLDDNGHSDHYYADIVLNQNIHADASLYTNQEPETRLLLGSQYVLLRKEFWPWRGYDRQIAPVVRNVLVTMGGSDPHNLTARLIRILNDMPHLRVTVVVGLGNTRYPELVAVAQPHIHLMRNVENMPKLYAENDLAIAAAGSTCWELAFISLPMVLIVTAENQRKAAEALMSVGVGINLGWHTEITHDDIFQVVNVTAATRYSMSNLAHQLVDGYGGQRICEELR